MRYTLRDVNWPIVSLTVAVALGLLVGLPLNNAQMETERINAEVARSQALAACRMHPQEMPYDEHGRNLRNYIAGKVTLSQLLYTYNMYSPSNLAWIDCLMQHAPLGTAR